MQEEQEEQEQADPCHDLYHGLCQAVEEEAKQPTAEPNEGEGDYTQEAIQVQQRDHHLHDQQEEVEVVVVVEVVGPYASDGHGVEYGEE